MSPSQKKSMETTGNFLENCWTVGNLALSVQSQNPHGVAEVMQYSLGQLGSTFKAVDKNHHWGKHGVSSYYSYCFLP